MLPMMNEAREACILSLALCDMLKRNPEAIVDEYHRELLENVECVREHCEAIVDKIDAAHEGN